MDTTSMRPRQIDRPLPLVLIASFLFLKAGFLVGVSAVLWIAPEMLPNSSAFSQVLFIAAHGRNISGFLVPVFGCYVAYVGYGLSMLRPSFRRNLAISSAITIAVSMQRLG